VPILRAIDHVSQKSIYFHDPDKNLLEIVWERPMRSKFSPRDAATRTSL